jgi:hypothetical protein
MGAILNGKVVTSPRSCINRFESRLHLSSDPSNGEPPVQDTDVVVVSSNDSEVSKYPIDLPSPLLLAGSVLLAIVSTGIDQV